MSSVSKQPVSEFNPAYGCVIMIMAVLVFGGIIGWSAYTFLVQDKVIGNLTVDKPAPMPAATLSADATAALQKRLTDFAAAVTANQPAELSLTLAELNAILPMAPDTGSGTFADKLHFTRTDPAANTLIAQASLPMNKKFWEEGFRYLVGEVSFYIYVDEKTGADAKISDVKIPGKEVEPGLIRDMGRWPFLGFYHDGPVGPVLKAIKEAKVTPEGLLLSTQKK